MSVNASKCVRCGLLSRDFSFEEHLKAHPTCLSCVTGTKRRSKKQLSTVAVGHHHQRTCTRCGSRKHLHADFTAEERASKTPVCRTCILYEANHSSTSSTSSSSLSTKNTTASFSSMRSSLRGSSMSNSSSSSRSSSAFILSKRQQRKAAHALEELEELTQQLEQAKVRAHQLEEEREARLVPGRHTEPATTNKNTDVPSQQQQHQQQRQGNQANKNRPPPAKKESSPSQSTSDTQQQQKQSQSPPQSQPQPKQSSAKTKAQQKMDQLKASYSKRDEVDEIQHLYMALVETLLQPHRIWGVPLQLRNKKDLFDYLTKTLDVYHEPTAWLVQPLLQGLLEYRDYQPSSPEAPMTIQPNAQINVRIGFGNDQKSSIFYSLLAWTCHDEYLRQACGWKGGPTMVQIVLASPGVNVNDVFFNKMHAGFFAVLYSSSDTLEALVQAGLHMSQRDFQNRGLLYHTLEYPHPQRVRGVLNHLPHNLHHDPDTRDCAVHLLKIGSLALQVAAQASVSNSNKSATGFSSSALPACWNMLGGPPPLEHVAESLIVVRQRGVVLANLPSELSQILQSLNPFIEHPFVLHLTGQWLPPDIQQRIRVRDQDAVKQESGETVTACQIHGLDTSVTMTTLACGHLFCHGCVTEYNDHNYQGRPLCPVCARRLSKEIMLLYPETGFGSGNARHDLEHEQLKAFSFLNDSQLKHEAKHQGLQPGFLTWSMRDKLLNHLLECHLQPPPAMMGGMSAILNLSATHTHVETHSHGMTLAPTHGPTCVEIWIKGVPVLAHLNNTSRWTNISSELVKMLNLEAMPQLKTARVGIPVSCVRDLTFTIGNHGNSHTSSHNTQQPPVSVSLPNAVVVPAHLMRGMGISLGLDFFLSATYCCVDINVMLQEESAYTTRRGGIPTTMRCDGLFSWSMEDMPETDEMLRYYARNGQMVTLPLYHFNTCRADQYELPTLFTLEDAHQDEECYWCCRQFPKDCGMVYCQPCLLKGVNVPYCDERCQRAAESVHKGCCGRLGGK